MRLVRPSEPTPPIVITGALPDAGISTWSGATTYAATARAFYTVGNYVYIYESKAGGNVGHLPTDETYWLYVGASNPYRMFDQVSGSQSTGPNIVGAKLYATPLANTVALLNISGTAATVTIRLPDNSIVYTRTQSLLVAGDGVTNWYEYFFGDMGRRNNALFVDLPSYANQSIEAYVTEAGATVAIGTLAIGFGYDIGATVYGAKIGIDDYSRKTANEFGGYDIVERAFAKTMSVTVVLPNSRFDEIASLLPQYRATPTIWIGADDFGATFILGFYKSFSMEIRYPTVSYYTLEIEGLI